MFKIKENCNHVTSDANQALLFTLISFANRYRLTVIRNLPQLQKLDNITIQADEMADAMRRGQELLHPFDQVDSYHTPIPYQPPLQQVKDASCHCY